MKAFITPSYTFSPGASGSGTVNLSGITGFDVKRLVAIINQTRGIVIYSTGSATLKYSAVSGTTVTLFADTSAQNSADVLQVIYDDASVQALDSTAVANGVLMGPVAETAPATDIASSGLNGRLQRIAQRLSSLIALLPATIGQKNATGSLSVVLASDQAAIPQAVRTPSYQELLGLTTVQTITAPANAKWCKMMNVGAEPVRMKMGGTASTTSGMRLEAGRSEDFDVVGNISVISESGVATDFNVIFGV